MYWLHHINSYYIQWRSYITIYYYRWPFLLFLGHWRVCYKFTNAYYQTFLTSHSTFYFVLLSPSHQVVSRRGPPVWAQAIHEVAESRAAFWLPWRFRSFSKNFEGMDPTWIQRHIVRYKIIEPPWHRNRGRPEGIMHLRASVPRQDRIFLHVWIIFLVYVN